jgi:hypothetical protein
MLTEDEKRTAELAAEWWANQLRPNPTALDLDHETYDEAISRLYSKVYAPDDGGPTEDQIELFRAELLEILMEEEDFDAFMLEVDYEPCEILSKALENAGISAKLPIKTTMWLDDRTVSKGYGAPFVPFC